MKWKGRGRYTVEGTLIISFICLVTGLVILFGFYGHDRAVIQSTADKLSRYGSLWAGRYLHPEIREVDYELMKQGGTVDFGVIEDMGCRMLQGRLFCGELRNIRASQSLSGREVQVEIQTDFQIGKYDIPCKVKASSVVFRSRDLPRINEKNQEDETDESGTLSE